MAPPDRDTVRCPTCRAAQEWSDTCRRCQSDLRLLRRAAQAYHQHRRACLLHLRAGHPRAAALAAHRCRELCADPESRRLEALAALLQGDWPTAEALARRLLQEGGTAS